MKKTKKIKALIIDDESRAINVLRLLIQNHVPEIDTVISSNQPDEALYLIQEAKPDLLFLDIQMPHMNGFELLQALPEHPFEVIFTTAFNQYAIQAIRISAIDYLLKPIQVAELKTAVKRFIAQKNTPTKNWDKLYKNFVNNLENKIDLQAHRLPISSQEGTLFLSITDILRCEASSNYTYFFMLDGTRHLASKTLKEYEDSLQSHYFLRVHKSHLINMKHVTECVGNELFLTNGSKVEISRRRKAYVLHQLKNR